MSLPIDSVVETKEGVPKDKSKRCSKVVNSCNKNPTGADNWKCFLNSNLTSRNKESAGGKGEQFLTDKDGKPCRCVAIDCEMVGIEADKKTNMLARVSIVNALGDCLYDTFVKPTAPVTDYRTAVSGVRPIDLEDAEKFSVVQNKVADIIKGKILVGHAVHNDLVVLKLHHPRQYIRDTSRFTKFSDLTVGTPSLKRLTSHFLQVSIQDGEHNSIQDAQAAMQLYMLHRKEWEMEVRKRRHIGHYSSLGKRNKTTKTVHRPRRLHKNYKK